MKLLPLDKFLIETMGGFPVRANMAAYSGKSFQCACGTTHQFSGSQDEVLREISGMRFVFRCPERKGVTLIKIKGIFSIKLESLIGAKDED